MDSPFLEKLRQKSGVDAADNGFIARDIVRFIAVDIILICAVRLADWLGLIHEVNQYVIIMLGSKVVLFAYLFWLVAARRQALPATGVTSPGRWWAWPLGAVIYAGCYPLLLFVNRANAYLMEALYGYFGWVYNPNPQEVLLYLFAGVLDTPVLLLLLFFTLMAGPFMEELAFRGVGLDAYQRTSGTVTAVVVTSLLFGLFHFDLILVLPLAFLGAVFAAVRLVSGSLWVAAAIHSLHNTVTLLILAYQLGFLDSVLEYLARFQPPQ
ncbi:MAG: CPBP family intramembrane metalloprotease [Planctomycetes bacterium]|nr:CPBP family intramembrane metalloprotease [Planctomycetota bacterium]MCC8116351.1 CPBP family intramembrane metalloprotease [Planctomycetota bacterium]MCD7896114.1 CPBP family intramembrane metalloprotease [Planctomycetaceae bacterium]